MYSWTTTTDNVTTSGQTDRLDDAWRRALAAAEDAVTAGSTSRITVTVDGDPAYFHPAQCPDDPEGAKLATLHAIHDARGDILAGIDTP